MYTPCMLIYAQIALKRLKKNMKNKTEEHQILIENHAHECLKISEKFTKNFCKLSTFVAFNGLQLELLPSIAVAGAFASAVDHFHILLGARNNNAPTRLVPCQRLT